MKQSELKHWKWDAKAAWWLSDVLDMEVEADGIVKTWKPSPNQNRWTPQALVNVAREFLAIAEHIEAGRFGPDEETTSRKQREDWFRRQSDWQLLGPDTGAGVYEHATTGARVWSGDSSKAVRAIAMLEQRPEAEIVREMLEL